jgi:hypothetical protein
MRTIDFFKGHVDFFKLADYWQMSVKLPSHLKREVLKLAYIRNVVILASSFRYEHQYCSIFKSFESLAAQTVRPDIVYIVGAYDDRLNIEKLKFILGDIELKCFKQTGNFDDIHRVFTIMKYLRDTDNISFITPEDVFLPRKIEIVADLLKTCDIVEHSYCLYGGYDYYEDYARIVTRCDKHLVDQYYKDTRARTSTQTEYFLHSLRGIALKKVLTELNEQAPTINTCSISIRKDYYN